MSSPKINVTPLIDVLLVLLIIFMVVAPLKPSTFRAKVPAEPDVNSTAETNGNSLVVSIGRNLSLALNNEKRLGSVEAPDPLVDRLRAVFEQRMANGDINEQGNTVKAVFIKAPKNIGYGSVIKVIDAVKQAGAEPLALQIDYLE